MRKKVLCLLSPILLHAAITWAQWLPQIVTGINPNHTITSIAAVNENVVWAIVDTNYFAGPANVTSRFLRTTNGGTTWKTGTIPNTKNFFFMDIAATYSNTAWVTINNFATGGGIYKTTDGGASWTRQASIQAVFISLLIGTLAALHGDTLFLQKKNSTFSAPSAIPLAAITRLEVNRGKGSRGKSALTGSAIGLGAGVAATFVVLSASAAKFDLGNDSIFLGSRIGGAGGFALGGIIGSLHPREQWKDIPVDGINLRLTK